MIPLSEIPKNAKKVLVHSCCGPCSGALIEKLQEAGAECVVIFYNPNIHPEEEYQARMNEQKKLAKRMGVAFVELEYDPKRWLEATRGLEDEPERGRRCEKCFTLRLQRAARHAKENGIHVFTSTLGLSRFKDFEQVNRCGVEAASFFPDLVYWTYNWRKKGGSQRMTQIAKEQNLYRQNYCGCIYSKEKSHGKTFA